MNTITIEHNPSPTRLAELGVRSWPIWEKGASGFAWFYDEEDKGVEPETPRNEEVDMPAQQPTLRFHPLQSYPDFLRDPDNLDQRGVYVWGFRFFDPKTRTTTDFVPYYVGKSRSKDIHRRLQDHVHDLRRSTHKILRKRVLMGSDRSKYSPSIPEDCAYVAPRDEDGHQVKKWDLPPCEYRKLLPHIQAYTDNLYVTYLPVNHATPPTPEENLFIDRLERYVQLRIGIDRLACDIGRITLPKSFAPLIEVGPGTEHLFGGNGP